MENGKILLVNLSKGETGEMNSEAPWFDYGVEDSDGGAVAAKNTEDREKASRLFSVHR